MLDKIMTSVKTLFLFVALLASSSFAASHDEIHSHPAYLDTDKPQDIIYHIGLTEDEAAALSVVNFKTSVNKFYKNKLVQKAKNLSLQRFIYSATNLMSAGYLYSKSGIANTHSTAERVVEAGLVFTFANFVAAPGFNYMYEFYSDFSQKMRDPEYSKLTKIFKKVSAHANTSCKRLGGKGAKIYLNQDSFPLIPIALNMSKSPGKTQLKVFLDGDEVSGVDGDVYLVMNNQIVCDMGNYFEPLNDLIESKPAE